MHTLDQEFSGDKWKLLEVPLSHKDHCSRKSHLLGPINWKGTRYLSY